MNFNEAKSTKFGTRSQPFSQALVEKGCGQTLVEKGVVKLVEKGVVKLVEKGVVKHWLKKGVVKHWLKRVWSNRLNVS